MVKPSVAVIFGGRSVEHEVSIITGHQAMDALEHAGYPVLPIYITKDGDWYAGPGLHNLKVFREQTFHASTLDGVQRVSLSPDRSIRQLVAHVRAKTGFFGKSSEPLWADVFFPTIHGTFGEDGTLQGLFEMADVPYVGSGVLASALGLDKVFMKAYCRGSGFPVLEGASVTRDEFATRGMEFILALERDIPYPVIVKPAALGSSIGVSVCHDRAEVEEALTLALELDTHALVERALEDFSEINCSVLGPPERASVCEQPVRRESVLSFDDKYKGGGKKLGGAKTADQGMGSLNRIVPAPIEDTLRVRVETLSIDAFRAIGASGVARLDFLYDRRDAKLYLNEINTMPGSLAFYLWEASGVMFDELVETLVTTALNRHQLRRDTQFHFPTNLLR